MTQKPLAIYIHWPFCRSKCPYCDFNSHVREQVDHDAWRRALLIELEWMAQRVREREVTSIFFGGGTPSLMPPQTAAALIERICTLWPIAENMEITLEANPTSVEANTFTDFCNAGINRVSLGVQSLDDAQLKFLGREHSAKEALAAVEKASATFDRYTFDLIYARPNQTPEAWQQELQQALGYADKHLSLYQLTIEENTAFAHAYAKGELPMPGEETSEALYLLTEQIMNDAGLPAYEVSNYAAPGEESRHNMAYWKGWDYIGIGPGAHGRICDYPRGSLLPSAWDTLKAGSDYCPPSWAKEVLSADNASLKPASCDLQEQITEAKQRIATSTLKSPERWLSAVLEKGNGIEVWDEMTLQAMQEEKLLMGLRLIDGIALQEVTSIIDENKRQLFTQEGLLENKMDMLQTTLKGRLVLNSLTSELLA